MVGYRVLKGGARGRQEEGQPGAKKDKTTWNRHDLVSGEGWLLQTELSLALSNISMGWGC